MPTPCNDLSLVARNLTQSRKHGDTVSDVHQRPCAAKGTNDPCQTTRISLEKDWNRHFKNATYLLVDYFSRYPEIQKLSTTTSHSTESDVRMIRNSRDNGQ